MSWVAGCLTIENESQKEINRAKTHIRNVVRNNADLGEFPNMGDSLNRIKFVNPDTIPSSIEEAERISDKSSGIFHCFFCAFLEIIYIYRYGKP